MRTGAIVPVERSSTITENHGGQCENPESDREEANGYFVVFLPETSAALWILQNGKVC